MIFNICSELLLPLIVYFKLEALKCEFVRYCKLRQLCSTEAVERAMADIAVFAVTATVLQLAGALTEPGCPVKQGAE